MRIAVIYQSHYGTTKQYAAWIAEALGADLLERKQVKPEQLADYELIVYGGGLYAGGISGVDLVTKHPCRKLVLFTVGLADPPTTDYSAILEKNLSPALRAQVRIFHLRGGIDYGQLSLLHKGMMHIMKKSVEKQPEHKRTEEDREFLASYGGQVDFCDAESIRPLLEYVQSLQEA